MAFTNPLTPARLAAAIAATTLTVTGQVTTTPTTDEDDVRVYNQTQIDALSAADKNTNFVIWNTTTNRLNACVNGNIVTESGVPKPTASGQVLTATGTTDGAFGFAAPAAAAAFAQGATGMLQNVSIPTAYSGTPYTFTATAGANTVLMMIGIPGRGLGHWAFVGPTLSEALTLSLGGAGTALAMYDTASAESGRGDILDQSSQSIGLYLRNMTYNKSTGVVSFEMRSTNTNASSFATILRWRAF